MCSKKIVKFLKSNFDRSETLKEETKTSLKSNLKSISLCVLVRFVLIIQCVFCIYYIVLISSNEYFLALTVCPILIFIYTVYSCVFRNGKEVSW